jgi:hypothetical protein
MILNLSNQKTVEKSVGCAMMGLRVNTVTMDYEDLYKLLQMDDEMMRFWLSSLCRRVEPRSERAG